MHISFRQLLILLSVCGLFLCGNAASAETSRSEYKLLDEAGLLRPAEVRQIEEELRELSSGLENSMYVYLTRYSADEAGVDRFYARASRGRGNRNILLIVKASKPFAAYLSVGKNYAPQFGRDVKDFVTNAGVLPKLKAGQIAPAVLTGLNLLRNVISPSHFEAIKIRPQQNELGVFAILKLLGIIFICGFVIDRVGEVVLGNTLGAIFAALLAFFVSTFVAQAYIAFLAGGATFFLALLDVLGGHEEPSAHRSNGWRGGGGSFGGGGASGRWR
ncbi:MAG: TPM domain-containing protein [bacterium]|nr:TPM domain-containing protein [bacterium]